jgi:hypothetical protein
MCAYHSGANDKAFFDGLVHRRLAGLMRGLEAVLLDDAQGFQSIRVLLELRRALEQRAQREQLAVELRFEHGGDFLALVRLQQLQKPHVQPRARTLARDGHPEPPLSRRSADEVAGERARNECAAQGRSAGEEDDAAFVHAH